MFVVYGLQGKLLNVPLDRPGAVRAVARLRGLAAVEREDQPGPAAVLAGRDEADGGVGDSGGGRPAGEGRQGAAAYSQTAAPQRQPLTLVRQLMSRDPVSVPLASTVGEAWARLARADVGQAPVLNEAGTLVGLVSRADLLRGQQLPQDLAEAPAWAQRLAQPVATVMWSPVPSAQPDTGVREAAQLLLELHLPGLPVLDEQGRLQGFLSRSDLLRALTHEPPLDVWS